MHCLGKGREARRNDERLYFKFIVKYFEELHPEIYTKATNLHEEVKKSNPNVRDLTKTAEFMTTVTPNMPVPAYYYRRQLKANIEQRLQMGARMVLEIPLDRQQTSPPVTVPVTAPSPPVTVPSPPVTAPSPPVTVASPPVPVPTQPAPLLMQDSTFQQLLEEIQQDANLRQILNDFNMDDDDDMNSHVWDDLYIPDDISPLEIEIDGQ